MFRHGRAVLNGRLPLPSLASRLPTSTPLPRHSQAALLQLPLQRTNLLLLPSIQFRTIIKHAHPEPPKPPKENLVKAPRYGEPQLLERREDRELPDVTKRRPYLIHIPLFIITMIVAAALLFNYQRSSSSVVSSTLYALRVHPKAREALGNEIQFRAKWPWISGKLDQLHGKIEISYKVKGSKAEATMTFKSYRRRRQGTFKTEEWSITTDGGEKIDLLEEEEFVPF